MIDRPDAPTARAAVTYSRSLMPNTSASIIRVKRGKVENPTAIMMFVSPGPSVAMIASARRSVGKASIASVTRIMTVPTLAR